MPPHYLQRLFDLSDADDLAVGDVAARYGELEVAAHQQLWRHVLQLQLGQFRKLREGEGEERNAVRDTASFRLIKVSQFKRHVAYLP